MEPLKGTDGSVFVHQKKLFTLSLDPGNKVYGEKLLTVDGTEYREWPSNRSKLSAYLALGGVCFPFSKASRVLYLGASSGTTASHISDIVADGRVDCVEFAPRMFRDLIRTCERRRNMNPILGDATNPSEYRFIVSGADIVYADVAQKKQADIIADNMDMFGAHTGMLAVKARSEDVSENPSSIFRNAEKNLMERGFRILDSVDLDPYEKDHRMIVFKRRS